MYKLKRFYGNFELTLDSSKPITEKTFELSSIDKLDIVTYDKWYVYLQFAISGYGDLIKYVDITYSGGLYRLIDHSKNKKGGWKKPQLVKYSKDINVILKALDQWKIKNIGLFQEIKKSIPSK